MFRVVFVLTQWSRGHKVSRFLRYLRSVSPAFAVEAEDGFEVGVDLQFSYRSVRSRAMAISVSIRLLRGFPIRDRTTKSLAFQASVIP